LAFPQNAQGSLEVDGDVIFQFLGRVGGDHVSMLPDEIAKARQGPVGHLGMILSLLSLAAQRNCNSLATQIVEASAQRSQPHRRGAARNTNALGTEAFLAGKSATLDTFEHAGRIARDEIKPISDVRGSTDYRLQLAENIMAKFWY
jgi:hypothetical protein